MPEIEMTPLAGRPARWLTNAGRDEAHALAVSLRAGRKSRDIAVGDPKPTAQYSADDLRRMGMVGLYDVASAED